MCALLVLSTASGVASGGEVDVNVPFCEKVSRPTGDYEIVSELVREAFVDYREETIRGKCVTNTTRVPYTAYRLKSEWVEKVVEITRTVWRPVIKWVQKVRSWFERTWLGKLVKRVASWLEPVTTRIKSAVVDRVVRSVKVITTEPYTAYRIERTRVCSPPEQVSVPFTNYRLVRKQKAVAVTIPGHKVVYRNVTVNARDIPASTIEDLFRRLPACEPFDERLQRIYAIWSDFKSGLAQYANAERQYDDALYIYMHGVPSEGWPGRTPALAGWFGEGPDAWDLGQANFTFPEANAAQYFRMRELVQEWGLATEYEAGTYKATHYNLCGELAVIAAVGDTVPHGLSVFHSTDSGREIIKQGWTTGWWDLEELFAQYEGWAAESATGAISQGELAEQLRQDEAVVALISLNTSSGHLEQGDGEQHIAHWVTVLEVLDTQDGQGAVRVYNSLQNREEYYTWAYFYDAWRTTNGNSSTFLRVTAQGDSTDQPVPDTPERGQYPEQAATIESERLPQESKPEAVRLSEDDGRPLADATRDVGIQRDQPNRSQVWFQSEGDEAFSLNRRAQDKEIQRRKRQVKRATTHRNILRRARRATLYFAK
jgi:hypothetical protein